MLTRSRPARLVAALALTLTAAACGDDGDDDVGSTDTTSAPAAAQTTAAAGPYATPETTAAGGESAGGVEVADSDLGQILVSEGRTLYLFMPDNAGAPTCFDDCAATWPPLLADDVTVGEGLDAALFATSPRDDGGNQVTVDGWPLYFFASDAAAGDHNGHGIGGVWFAVAPDGAPIPA